MFYCEHLSEEGEVFRVFKLQSVAIFDDMFIPDVYIEKTTSLVCVHYDIIHTIHILNGSCILQS
jgi:hypothetical protein